MEKPFDYTEDDLYRITREQGDKRFGSHCSHETVRDGRCVNCLRKVK